MAPSEGRRLYILNKIPGGVPDGDIRQDRTQEALLRSFHNQKRVVVDCVTCLSPQLHLSVSKNRARVVVDCLTCLPPPAPQSAEDQGTSHKEKGPALVVDCLKCPLLPQLHLSVSKNRPARGVDCQRVEENPSAPRDHLHRGQEGPGEDVPAYPVFDIVCSTRGPVETSARKEEDCPALPKACSCSQDSKGPPGPTGPPGGPGIRGSRGDQGVPGPVVRPPDPDPPQTSQRTRQRSTLTSTLRELL
ncbi:unnamed protein product [Arctogadus glacialis]